MAFIQIICAFCKTPAFIQTGAVNRARNAGRSLYCSRECSALGRRKHKSTEQRRAEKATYDEDYRAKNAAMIKAKKAAYFARTYDPVAAATERQKTMARHVEYCRRPNYKAYKREYDRRYRAENEYGPFADAFIALMDLQSEIDSRSSDYEIRQQSGTFGKTQKRKRNYESTISGRP